MKIAHYFLGFPPYRTGGMTKYAYDLMLSQKAAGDDVLAFWPGQMCLVNKKVHFKKKTTKEGIISIEIINPLPVSLDEGINDIDAYTRETDYTSIYTYLKDVRPDVVHIHTLMGLYKEFVYALKELGVKTVYTAHDYFGICPKVNLYHDGAACDEDSNCNECIECNKRALSITRIRIMQSPVYRQIKDSYLMRALRKKHRQQFFEDVKTNSDDWESRYNQAKAEDYKSLRNYYSDILETVDLIHFNSQLTKNIYERYVKPKKAVVMSITHKKIKDHRIERNWRWTGKLRIVCLAPARPYKGFNVLRTALDQLWEGAEINFDLKVFSPVTHPEKYMTVIENGFSQDELPSILGEADVLVAPSIWYETFGFTVLEALSYGVPVIVSDHVGSQDIVGSGGIIVPAGNVDALKCAITNMYESKCETFARIIKNGDIQIKPWNVHVKEIEDLYY